MAVRVVSMLAAVVAFGALWLFAYAAIFDLFFGKYTIHLTLFVAGWLLFRHGFVEYRNRLAVNGTATAKATSAAIGLAELCGRAYSTTPTCAPVSETPSVFWTVEVEQYQPKGDRRGWHRKLRRSAAPLGTLELEDETGRIVVWARGAEVIPKKQIWRSEDGGPPPAGLRLVAQTGIPWPEPSSRYRMKITEERIEHGGPLYVMGTLAERRQIPDAPRFRGAGLVGRWARSSPTIASQSFTGVFVFLCQRFKRKTADWVTSFSGPWTPPNVDPHQVVIWKGEEGRPFIVAGVVERETLTALSRRSWMYVLGGAGLMAAMLWTFLEKLAGAIDW